MYRYLCIIVITCFSFFSESQALDLNPSDSKHDFIEPLGSGKDTFNTAFKFQFSLGGGVRFYNHFIFADPILNVDIGFRLSKHFMLISGAEFWIYKHMNYDEGYGVEETTVFTGLTIAPAYLLDTKRFMFYAGGGAGWTIPSYLGLHFFLLTRAGYIISKVNSINLSIILPMYFNGKIEGLSASVMYTFLF